MQKGVLTVALGVALGLATATAQAAGDPAAGAAKANMCTTCHGAKGDSPIMADYPKLAGQNAAYLEMALKGFRDGSRGGGNSAMMSAPTSALSDQDIADLAAYFSQQ